MDQSIGDKTPTRFKEILTKFGFEKIQRINWGTTCNIYSIKKDNKIYALKVYRFNSNEEQELNDQFRAEFTIVTNIQHFNILKYYECNIEYRFLRMELLESNLENLLKGYYPTAGKQTNLIPEQIIQELLFQTVIALKYLHSTRIIHRDIKLQNILIHKKNQEFIVKVCDFGVSKIIDTFEKSSVPTSKKGSEPYMAPEMLLGKETRCYSIDIWSLGVLVYKLCTNRFPFGENNKPLLIQILTSGLESQIPQLVSVQGYSAELNCLLLKMFETNWNKRINSSEIINNPYFNDLKRDIISGNRELVEHYYIVLYQFENCEFEAALTNIEICLKRAISTKNFGDIIKFVILKMKIFLFTYNYTEFFKFYGFIKNQSQFNFGNLFNEINFYCCIQCMDLEMRLLNHELIKKEEIDVMMNKIFYQNKDSFIETKSVFYELRGLWNSSQNKTEALQDLKNAIDITSYFLNIENIGISLTMARLHYLIGCIHTSINSFDDALKTLKMSFDFLHEKKNTIDNCLYLKTVLKITEIYLKIEMRDQGKAFFTKFLDKLNIEQLSFLSVNPMCLNLIKNILFNYLECLIKYKEIDSARSQIKRFLPFFHNFGTESTQNRLALYLLKLELYDLAISRIDYALECCKLNGNFDSETHYYLFNNKILIFYVIGNKNMCLGLIKELRKLGNLRFHNNEIKIQLYQNQYFFDCIFSQELVIKDLNLEKQLKLNLEDEFYLSYLDAIKCFITKNSLQLIQKEENLYNQLKLIESSGISSINKCKIFYLMVCLLILLLRRNPKITSPFNKIFGILNSNYGIFPNYMLYDINFNLGVEFIIESKFQNAETLFNNLLQNEKAKVSPSDKQLLFHYLELLRKKK